MLRSDKFTLALVFSAFICFGSFALADGVRSDPDDDQPVIANPKLPGVAPKTPYFCGVGGKISAMNAFDKASKGAKAKQAEILAMREDNYGVLHFTVRVTASDGKHRDLSVKLSEDSKECLGDTKGGRTGATEVLRNGVTSNGTPALQSAPTGQTAPPSGSAKDPKAE